LTIDFKTVTIDLRGLKTAFVGRNCENWLKNCLCSQFL